MARMPGVIQKPTPNCTTGGQDSVHGVVLHIMEGTLDGSDSWFRNPAAQASAHFGVGKNGTIYQWVDTADRAWAQAAGNRTWLSIEHEGYAGDVLTAKQLAATASIVAWAAKTYGFPLVISDDVNGKGLGWHGMGGISWGGHTGCPGEPIKAQRAAILIAAKVINAPAPTPTPSGSTYTVKKGDTLGQIAANHGVTLDALLAANPAFRAHPDSIQPGDKINIPAAATKYVIVKSGDTLGQIAEDNGLTLAAILKLNPAVKDANLINPGDKIRVK